MLRYLYLNLKIGDLNNYNIKIFVSKGTIEQYLCGFRFFYCIHSKKYVSTNIEMKLKLLSVALIVNQVCEVWSSPGHPHPTPTQPPSYPLRISFMYPFISTVHTVIHTGQSWTFLALTCFLTAAWLKPNPHIPRITLC